MAKRSDILIVIETHGFRYQSVQILQLSARTHYLFCSFGFLSPEGGVISDAGGVIVVVSKRILR